MQDSHSNGLDCIAKSQDTQLFESQSTIKVQAKSNIMKEHSVSELETEDDSSNKFES